MGSLSNHEPKRKHRLWPWVLVCVVLLFVPGMWQALKEKPADTKTKTMQAQGSEAPGSSQSTSIYWCGSEFRTGSFAVRVPAGSHVVYTTTLSSELGVKTVEDAGTFFCLVPVCIRNVSASTSSFLPLGWYLHAGGLRFETSGGADYYIDPKEHINPSDVPPGVTRCGKLVFLVTAKAKAASTLLLELDDWGRSAKLEVPQAE